MRFTPKKITLLIVGVVFTAGLAMSFVVPVFAAKNFNSSKSNTSTAIVNQQVGDILLRYGVGGAEINNVTDALARGISDVDLKAMLIEIGINEEGVQEVFTKLDELGAGADSSTTGLDAPTLEFTTGDPAVSAPAAGGNTPQGSGDPLKGLNPTGGPTRPNPCPPSNPCPFPSPTVSSPPAAEDIQPQAVGIISRVNRPENAKALRDNFRENVKTTIGHVDHGKTARIAVAHGKGLRMLNRFRSAMARFDHILGRLESRIEKMRIEFEAEEQAIGNVNSKFPPKGDGTNVYILIEEAKNMQVENEAKMEELKAKYESLLEGRPRNLGEGNPWLGDIAAGARALATELKTDIENLRAIIIEIYTQECANGCDYNSSRSNTSI